ncbi:hypothetical protein D9758_003945 [Tetrapyrgos nigripes]|uniref:AAA+ ATPase domain-containing protein n=1 Tax=Tetrapyrgos nigripes TaxID=182062 RepID=A0A8H5GLL9_9AGAR|nr:hypothetical protein D9758_003945 [Tetrapyrgos nigripes]
MSSGLYRFRQTARRRSTPMSNSSETTTSVVTNGDAHPQPEVAQPEEPPVPMKLDAKRIQLRWDDEEGNYVARDDEPKAIKPQKPQEPFAISIARRFVPSQRQNKHDVVEEIHIHSSYIVEVLKIVMKDNRSINWKAEPLKFEPNALLPYLPFLLTHSLSREFKDDSDFEEKNKHISFFISFLGTEYRSRLQELAHLLSDEQITLAWIPGLFLPGDILFTHCSVTGDPCAVRLTQSPNYDCRSGSYRLYVEYVNVQSKRPGLSSLMLSIEGFDGTKRISDLEAYPFKYVQDKQEQRASLIERGKKHWDVAQQSWKHMQYDAIAYRLEDRRYRKVFVKSRVMIDTEMFDQYASYSTPSHYRDLDGKKMTKRSRTTLTDNDFLLFAAKTYGYSLSEREWLEFRVADLNEVKWNPSVFDSLQLDADNKYTVRALIESQCNDRMNFDDFVLGKGRGLIFNLHGPPGVGKTLTAEATSEVTRSPLYMIGAGDLGITAGELDNSLARVSTLAYRWKAVVLIDEADVFLEKRETRDIQRNAMVAVFLRQLEYYAGILFLTTNRVEVFDEAMMSRIHVTLHYDKLTPAAREHLWDAFLQKANYPSPRTPSQTEVLRELPLNGREIKNVVKVATTLASYENRDLVFEDVMKALKILGQTQVATAVGAVSNASEPVKA